MSKLTRVVSVDGRAEGAQVEIRNGAFTLSIGFKRAILRHFYKYYVHVPRTPVPHLFKTNAVPSAEDLAKIHAYIRQLEEIVISCESSSPSSSKRYRGNKADKIAAEHRRLRQTTIRNLPPDIIQRIIYFSLSSTFVGKECLPWVASWVCSSWRRTVLRHHHLWGVLPKIDLRMSVFHPAKKKIVQELLRRSGDTSLSINIKEIDSTVFQGDLHYKPLLDLLLGHSHRYVDVCLDLPGDVVSSIVLSTFSQWRRLRHLSLKINQPYRSGSSGLDLRRFTLLRSIEVSGNIWSQVLLPLRAAVPAMYTLGGANLSPENWLGTLDSPTENRGLSVSGEGFPRVLAPRAIEIVLHDRSPTNPLDYWTSGLMALECYVTHFLHTLKVSFTTISTLDRLGARLSQATSLTTLHLFHRPGSSFIRDDVAGLSGSMLFGLIGNTPNVVHLEIAGKTWVLSFLCLIAYYGKPHWVRYPLPQLKHLTIHIPCNVNHGDGGQTHDILFPLSRLTSLRMGPPASFEDGHLDRLETLKVVLLYTEDLEKRSGTTCRSLAPHVMQDRVRGLLSGWLDPSEDDGDAASHPSLVDAAREMRYSREMIESLSARTGNIPRSVFAETERRLGKVLEGIGSGGPLSFGPIENVYGSGAYYQLRELKKVLESGMPGFSTHHQTSVQLANRILESWEPRLAELASKTKWFNLGTDTVFFLLLDDPRRLEEETRDYLVKGFPSLRQSPRHDAEQPHLPPLDTISMEF